MRNQEHIPSTAAEQTIQDAYIAYYGRPADPGGLAYWASRLDDASGNLNEIIDAFGNSTEFTDRFGGLDTGALINAVYQRLFKRDAGEGGLTFYTELLENGQKSLGTIALDVLNGSQGYDLILLNEKRDVAAHFTNVVEVADLDYSGERGIAAGTGVMGVIGSGWTEAWRADANYIVDVSGFLSFYDEYIRPYYMANQFAEQLDDDPTHTTIDRFVDVGRDSLDALYLPWAGELVIEGVLDGALSPDGATHDIDKYRVVNLAPGSYDIELTVDGGNSETRLLVYGHRHDLSQYADNGLLIGHKAHHTDGPNFHQQLQFEDEATWTFSVAGPTSAGTYTLAITPSETDYPIFDPDWQHSPNAEPEFWSDFYDYLFI